MIWADVQAIRKSGRFQEAIDHGLQALVDNPDDFKLRTQIDWAFYGLIKNHVSSIVSKQKGGSSPNVIVNQIYQVLRCYARQPKRRPDNALSYMLRELSKIAPQIPFLPNFIRWVGMDGLAAEDWQYSQRDGKRFQPIALGIARGLAKWVKASPEAAQEDIDLALEWIDSARSVAEGDDALWMDWDRVFLLQRLRRYAEAAGVLGAIIKAKRNEFWVWAEAARLYKEEQPDLALACFCRALECSSDSKFTVKIHRELAQMLADRGQFAQASCELATVIAIRQEQGWRIDSELQNLINSSWFDPLAKGAEMAKDFYNRNSQDALILCFDSVEEIPATYLGVIQPKSHKDQPRKKVRSLPRFAIRELDGSSVSIVGSGIYSQDMNIGDPVTLVLGRHGDRDAILQVSVRSDGSKWDCTDSGAGLVTRVSGEGWVKVFINRDLEVGVTWIDSHTPKVGEGVRFRVTQNRKNGRKDIFSVEPGSRPEVDVKVSTGHLKRNPKGFAFVDDAFVPPFVVDTIPSEVDSVLAVLVYSKHPKESRYGWRAVSITPA